MAARALLCNVMIAVIVCCFFFFFVMIRRPPRSTQGRSSAASDVYKRQLPGSGMRGRRGGNALKQEETSLEEALDDLEQIVAVSYTHLRAHETVLDLVCRLLLEKKKKLAIRH